MAGDAVSFRPAGLIPGKPVRLRARFAPTQSAVLRVASSEREVAAFELAPADHWVELEREVPSGSFDGESRIRLEADGDNIALYHFWILQTP